MKESFDKIYFSITVSYICINYCYQKITIYYFITVKCFNLIILIAGKYFLQHPL